MARTKSLLRKSKKALEKFLNNKTRGLNNRTSVKMNCQVIVHSTNSQPILRYMFWTDTSHV